MRIKRLLAAALTAVMLSSLFGCTQLKEAIGANVRLPEEEPEEIVEQSVHIRDKDLLYQQYDNTEIVPMYLTVSYGNEGEGTNHTWEEINTYSVYDYDMMGVERYKVAGLIQIGNEEGVIGSDLGYGNTAPNCTVQIRGQSSSRNAQKNYKISIKENKGEWRGQTTIALNKHQSDGLRFRNKLGFDLLTHIEELMSLRTTFVRLYVKDTTESENARFEDYGIYTQVEQLNKTALKVHGLDNRGHLYKINFCEFYRYEDTIVTTDDLRYDLKKFEEILEVKGDDDHKKLINMLERVNDYSIPIEQILKEDFDIENVAYWMAYNLLLGNVDTQSRNFYLYSPQNVDRWYILPWDLDGMMRRTENSMVGRTDYEEWESGVGNYWGNILFKRCLQSEVYRDALDAAVEDIKSIFTPELINGYVTQYSSLLKPLLYTGRDAIYMPITKAQYDKVAEGFYAEIEDNYRRYKDSYENPMPFYVGNPLITADGYSVEWEGSYDFDGEDITYTFELAKNYDFKNPILVKTGLEIPIATFEKLPAGQYFMRVSATNESGRSQYAFDYYFLDTGKVYGTKSFYVDKDGNITEDVYVE